VNPFATKPATGIRASRTIRVRTENELSMRVSQLKGSDKLHPAWIWSRQLEMWRCAEVNM
jgi:hypothetical protein